HRPWLEALEDRLSPALLTWTGEGLSNTWNDASNWRNIDGGHQAPNPTGFVDTLQFPELPTDPGSKLNQTIGFSSGFFSTPPQFAGIIYQGSGYSVLGGAVFALDGGGIDMTAASGFNTIAAGIDFAGISSTLDVAAGGRLNLTGTV